MNLNELAKEISKLEGGKKELSIAQIKEVIKCLSIVLYLKDDDAGLAVRLWKNGKKWAGKK